MWGIIQENKKIYKRYKVNIYISYLTHQDHLNQITIKQIAYNYPTMKFVVGSIDLIETLLECGVRTPVIYALNSNKWYNLGAIKIKLERVTHDVPNHLCKFQIKDKKGIYIVDTSNVKNIIAKDYDLFLIEANYKKEILEQNELNNPDDVVYYERVKQTHLAYEDANSFLIENMNNNSVYEYIHQSKMNFKEE